jgi:hypothetical protein
MIDNDRHFGGVEAAYKHAIARGANIFCAMDVVDIAVDQDGEPHVLITEGRGLRWVAADHVWPPAR